MIIYYMLNKVLYKIKEIIRIEKSDDTNILIDTGDKLQTIEKCCDINDM